MNELSASDQAAVKKGQPVLVTEPVDGKPWPRVKVYRTVDATPEQVAAIFTDYSKAKGYVPNILKSEIADKVTPATVDVEYGLDIPIFPDEYYTMRNVLSCPEAGVYHIDWKLLKAIQTKDTVGCLHIEPYGDKSLICYQNLVTPASFMAPLLRGKAIDQMQETVKAIAAHVEEEKKSDPAMLEHEVKALRDALASQTAK